MSQTAIFVIGALVWALTVYGVVMAGGYLLGEQARSGEPEADDG